MGHSNTKHASFFKYIIRAKVTYFVISRNRDSSQLSNFNGKSMIRGVVSNNGLASWWCQGVVRDCGV